MTTTTAKRVRAGAYPAGAPLPLAAPVAMLALLMSPQCGAEVKITPGVDLNETYTDNVRLDAKGFERSEFITEVAPSLSIVANSPRLKFQAAYQLQTYAYSDNKVENTNQSSRQLQAGGVATLLDETLFVDGTGSITRQSVSAFGPQASANLYSNANSSEVKSYRVSPYLVHRFGASATVELRYAHDLVNSQSIGFGRSVGDDVSLSLTSGQAFRKLSWSAVYSHRNLNDSIAQKSTTENALLNLRYRLSETFSLTGSGGYDKYDYQALGGTTQGKSWSGGFVWTPSLRTSLQATAGKRYFGSSYSLAAMHRSRHTVWNLSYNDAVTTTREQFLLPATVDTASLLNQLFAASFTDPVARQQAVDAYIRATGLPSSLANNINYFSNRFILQKQFQASAAFNTARTTTVFSLSSTKRNALSTQQTDSSLLGSSSLNLNDNTKQVGASILTNYQISSRTGVNLSATYNHTDSLSAFLTDNNKALRLGMTRQLHSKLKASVEIRRVVGTSATQLGLPYRENAVSATLSMQL
ncbi:MAG TPA: TIGR03016 family PEP-CTERM system-associated outer membrane protein [Telluria sp.]|nr:TIGR03016 family PEP-CTERM system-associated outer membrane protein [Telluria sp.]